MEPEMNQSGEYLLFEPVASAEQMDRAETLAREIWAEYYPPIIGTAQVEYMLRRYQSRQAITEQIDSGALYYLMRQDRTDVGYLAVQPRGVELFLSKIYVLAALRGRGIGRQAVVFAESLARERGLVRITLTVNKNNTDSIAAYERFGFRKVHAVVQDIGEGFVMDDYVMEKEVAL